MACHPVFSKPRYLNPHVALSSLFALGITGYACSTNDPPENYLPFARGKDDVNIAGSNTSGSKTPGAGGSQASTAEGATGGAGGSSTVAGAGGESSETTSQAASGSDGAPSTTGPGNDPDGPSCGPVPVALVPFSKQALRSAAADCAMHHFCLFEGHAQTLDDAVIAWAERGTLVERDRARSAWQKAMASWQQLELFQFGPMANPSPGAGRDTYQGQGIRDRIYAWPTTARCRVDEQVVSRAFVDHGMQGALISGRGLYAIETLLFYEGFDTACTVGSAAGKTWSTLDNETLAAYRADYALAVSEDIVFQIQGLSEAWAPTGGNFRSVFVDASGYPDEQEAMNVLAWSLVYIEKEVKDYKLGLPTGYTLTAPVAEAEAFYAGTASDNLVNNLLGFRSLFEGCGPEGEGLGFDDWLIAAGHTELAADISQAWASAFTAVSALPAMHSASAEQLDHAYLKVKALTDLLKNELLGAGSPLNLDLPATVEGDTD